MADPISRWPEHKRESGFQRSGEAGTDGGTPGGEQLPEAELLEATIRAHNQQLTERAGNLFELPLVVLTEQRDHALRRLAGAQERMVEQRRRLVAEQDKFISFLMTEHEAKLRELKGDCARLRVELEASRGGSETGHTRQVMDSWDGWNDSAPIAIDVTLDVAPEGAPLEPKLHSLEQALAAANNEIDETRADALRLQEERDDAIRATDDVRLELLSELEGARDEAFQLETQLDEAHRLLEDSRDQARDEVLRLTEELADLRAELDVQNAEVGRLRSRLLAHVASASWPGALANEVPRRSDVAPRRRVTPAGFGGPESHGQR